MADQPQVLKGSTDPLTGEPSQYLINPVTQDVEFAQPGDIARLKDEQRFISATPQQVDLFKKGYAAYQKEAAERARVRAEPVKQRAAAFAERLGEFINPADIAYGLTKLPTPGEFASVVSGLLPEDLARTGKALGTLAQSGIPQTLLAQRGGVAATIAGAALGPTRAEVEAQPTIQAARAVTAPLVTAALETKAGITTPEARRAREEEFPGMGWAALAASIVTPMGLEAALEKGATKVGGKAFGAAARAATAEAEAARAFETAYRGVEPALAEADAAVLQSEQYLTLARGAGTSEEIAQAEAQLVAARRNAVVAQEIRDRTVQVAEGKLSPELLSAATEAETKRAATEAFKAQEAAIKANSEASVYAARADLLQTLGKKRAPTAMNLISEGIGRPIVTAVEESALGAMNAVPGLNRAPQIVKDIVAKGIANGLGSAAEGAVFSLGHVANEDVLGPNHKLTGEQVLAAMEDGAWFGLKLGVLAGAGLPVAKGTSNALAGIGSGTRDLVQKWFGDIAAERTGARRDALQAAYDTRARFLTEDPGAVIQQEILNRRPTPPEPVAPVPPEAPTPTPIPEKPLPYKPEKFPAFEPEPVLRQPAPVELRPADMDKASIELADAFATEKAQIDDLNESFYGKFGPMEDVPLVNKHFEDLALAEKRAAKDAYLESIGGKTRSAAEHEALQAIMRDAVADVRGRSAAELGRLIDHAKGVIDQYSKIPPRERPVGVLRAMKGIVKDLETAAQKAELPSDYASIIDTGKRRFYELGKTPKPRPGVFETEVAQTGRQAARDAGKEFLLSRIDENKWGNAAARTAKRNAAYTKFGEATENFYSLISYTEREGVAGKRREIDAGKIKSWLEKHKKAEGVRFNRAYEDYVSARDQLVDEFRESTREFQGDTGIDASIGAIDDATRAYSAAEEAAIARAQNEAHEIERKALMGEISRLNEEIRNRNEIRQREYNALKEEFDAAEGATKEEAAQRIREWERETDKIEIADDLAMKEYQKQVKEIKARHADEVKQWQKQVEERKADAAEQVKLLETGMRSGNPAENVLLGYLVGAAKRTHPVVKGAAVAYKAGQSFFNNPISVYKKLAWLEKKSNTIRRVINEDVDHYVFGEPRAAKAIGMAVGMLSGDALDTEFERIKKEIRKLSADPLARDKALRQATGGIGDVAPMVEQAVQGTLAAAQVAVEARIPQPPANASPVAKANFRARDDQKRKTVNAYQTVNRPREAAQRILAGTATADERQIMDDVYPAMMEMMRQRIIERMRDNPQLDRRRAQIASGLLGIDLTGELELGKAAQPQYQQAPPQAQPQQGQQRMKIGQGQALEGISGRTEYNTAARREAQQ